MKALFYPHLQKNGGASLQERVIRSNGWEVTTELADSWDFAVSLNFNEKHSVPLELKTDLRLVINAGCTDVTKSHVEEKFRGIFGYSTLADLSVYGYAVKKSECQCAKDFQVVQTPCAKAEGYIYQKFFNSRIGTHWVRDFRFYFAFDDFVLVVRDKHVDGTFYGGKNPQEWRKHSHEKYFTPREIGLLRLLNKELGFEVGAVDVVRDHTDGRMYVLDYNNIAGSADFVMKCINPEYQVMLTKNILDRV